MLQGKTALVTGASRGIGRAIALELASQGANIIINYAGNQEKAKETAVLCEEIGKVYSTKTLVISADVSSSEQVTSMIEQGNQEMGSIDILVNNAGITKDGLLLRMSDEDFDAVLDTNLRGAFLCTRGVTRMMMKKRWGRIINLSSVVGILGQAGQVNYAASKAGVIGLTKSVARELASRNITVNAVAPGFIQTDMTEALTPEQKTEIGKNIPLERLGTVEDVAKLVGFLASEHSSYITGQVISVDGGMAM